MKRILAITALAALAGCHSEGTTHRTETVTRTEVVTESPSRARAELLEDLADDVKQARDSVAEGDALRRLRAYAADHKLTYTFNAYRADTDKKVEAPSTAGEPVRVELSFFRASQPLYSFIFVPRDNRNLQLIAAGQ